MTVCYTRLMTGLLLHLVRKVVCTIIMLLYGYVALLKCVSKTRIIWHRTHCDEHMLLYET